MKHAWLLILLLPLATDKGLDLPVDPDRREEQSEQPPKEDPSDNPSDTPPPTFWGEVIERRTVTYVVDRSCSMYSKHTLDPPKSRWEAARNEVTKSIGALPQDFKFNVVMFDHNAYPLFPEVQDANPAFKKQAIAWLNKHGPGGGTETGIATALALTDEKCDYIVVVTDGLPSYPLDKQLRIVKDANRRGVVIDCIAVVGTGGLGPYEADVDYFCGQLAAQNGGVYSKK